MSGRKFFNIICFCTCANRIKILILLRRNAQKPMLFATSCQKQSSKTKWIDCEKVLRDIIQRIFDLRQNLIESFENCEAFFVLTKIGCEFFTTLLIDEKTTKALKVRNLSLFWLKFKAFWTQKSFFQLIFWKKKVCLNLFLLNFPLIKKLLQLNFLNLFLWNFKAFWFQQALLYVWRFCGVFVNFKFVSVNFKSFWFSKSSDKQEIK